MGILENIAGIFSIIAGQIELVMAIVVLVGLLLQKKKPMDILLGVIKAYLGVLILKQGSTLLQNAYKPVMAMLQSSFSITGIVTENYSGMAAINTAIPELVTIVPMVMILGFLINVLLAKFGPLKVVFLTAHTMLAFATLTVWLVNWFFATTGITLLLVSALFCGIFWTVMPAWTYRYSKPFAGEGFTLGHISGMAAVISSRIGMLLGHTSKKGAQLYEEDDEDAEKSGKFSSLTRLFNDSNVVTCLLMTAVLAIGSLLAGKEAIMEAAGTTNWIIYTLELGGNFTVGIVVLMTGVRMMISELVPAFKGISDTFIPGAVPSVDMPVFFPLAPFSAILGFLGAFLGEFVGFFVLVSLNIKTLMIPGIIATFFDGGIAGVFGFKYGGKKAAILSGIVVGLLQILGGVLFTTVSGLDTLGATYGNTDFGSSMMILSEIMNVLGNVWFFVALLIAVYVIACVFLKKHFQKEEE
ncbi:hypothetical protein MKA38_08745 [[Clostridium] innocuum]|nr:hypothetical protein [[Clostridium] innocuum]